MKYKYLRYILALSLSLISVASPLPKVSGETKWYPINLNKKDITSIEVASYGLFAGQKSDKFLENPHNGIFFSEDFGESWKESGLKGMGITDIRVEDNRIYASAYYSFNDKPGGLYYSEDYGKSWSHAGKDLKATSLEIYDHKIFLGTRYNGVWVYSKDLTSWWKYLSIPNNQTNIKKIYKENNFLFFESESETLDSPENKEDPPKLQTFTAINNSIIAGTLGEGLFVSIDKGLTWQETEHLKDLNIYDLFKAGKSLFAVAKGTEKQRTSIYLSKDIGKTWEETNFVDLTNAEFVTDLAEIKQGTHSLIIAATRNNGLFETKVDYAYEKKPFLGKLWRNQGHLDLIDRITSFFDHEYPLLGYSCYKEPDEVSNTTLNFLGQRAKEPTIYYSSHNGYDFALSYGTLITAPADGIANYYYCPDCGHSIKINHQNGYETIYMHLQENGLITKNSKGNIEIKEGETIGKVGLTGKTTGPHLHFQVKKDSDGDGNFTDEYPEGIVDPFGWKNPLEWDPWEIFTWEDSRGFHQGTTSKYLWKYWWHSWDVIKIFKQNPILMKLGDIEIEIPKGIKTYPLALKLQKYQWIKSKDKKYIPNTSFILEARDSIGNLVHKLDEHITIRIKIAENILSEINPENLNIYHWNKDQESWESLKSTWDEIEKTILARTDEISLFAVLIDYGNSNEVDEQKKIQKTLKFKNARFKIK